MKSFSLESSDERNKRTEEENKSAMGSAWNIENFKLKNISKEKAESDIKAYWIFGLVSTALGIIVYSVQGQFNENIYDLIISLILLFFIYKRVSAAAVLFLIYFITGRMYLVYVYPRSFNIGTLLVFIFFLNMYISGTLGVIRYNQLKKLEGVNKIKSNVIPESKKIFCHNCGSVVVVGAIYCTSCGSKLKF